MLIWSKSNVPVVHVVSTRRKRRLLLSSRNREVAVVEVVENEKIYYQTLNLEYTSQKKLLQIVSLLGTVTFSYVLLHFTNTLRVHLYNPFDL